MDNTLVTDHSSCNAAFKCVWLTGLPGSGKTTLAYGLKRLFDATGIPAFVLDGDELRATLNSDLGFSERDRQENVRRTAELARLLSDAGLLPIVALISPFRSGRQAARALFPVGEFCEVFVDAPSVICEVRDPKGLYAKARSGSVREFTGISSIYEDPTTCELHLNTHEQAIADCLRLLAERVITGYMHRHI